MISRFSQLNLKMGKKLKNRVVVPAMASGTASSAGFVTPETLVHYHRLAQSGAGLIFVEYTYVDSSGRSEPNQLGASDSSQIDGLKNLAQTIQSSGAMAALQLTHSGGKTSKDLTGGVLMGPSPVSVPIREGALEVMTEMTTGEIGNYKEMFLSAVRIADKAGFDMVEFHSAHGYGLNQWLSPITNQRTDDYGGSTENRLRLLIEIIQQTRQNFPQLLISVRIPGQDLILRGLSKSEMQKVAKKLEQAGVDIINVSSGLGGWKRPRDRKGQGYLVDEASTIRDSTSLPVIGVGGIEHGSYIDTSLQAKHFDLAAVGRAILKDPHGWYMSQLNPHQQICC